MDNSNNKLSELLSITLLLLCVILSFIKIPYSGKSLFGSDFLYYFYPIKRFIRGCLSERIFPFWNPYLFSGSPFIANIQASMFYPLGFLYYLISQDSAYLYTTILHFALGSLFMYAFMRDISISQAGSLVASFVFSFNGFLLGHLYAGHLSFIQNYIWIPLVFLFLLRINSAFL